MTGIDIRKSIEPALSFFTLNGQSPILADSAVRKAVLAGIDRQQLQEIQFQGLKLTAPLPGSMVLLPFQDGYQDNFTKVITFNPQQAKQDLKAAGWMPGPDGIRVKDGTPLEFTYVNLGDDPVDKAVAASRPTSPQRLSPVSGLTCCTPGSPSPTRTASPTSASSTARTPRSSTPG
jgi:peptide/nickel transport system substrate-binding protein